MAPWIIRLQQRLLPQEVMLMERASDDLLTGESIRQNLTAQTDHFNLIL